MDYTACFPKRLLRLRKDRGISQKALACEFGLSDAAITMMEKGKRLPSFDVLVALAEYFHVPLDYLTGRGIFKDWEKIMEKKEEIITALLRLYPYLDFLDLPNQSEETLMSVLPSLIKKIDFLDDNKIVIYPLLHIEKRDKD